MRCVALPPPVLRGKVSLEEAVMRRRSIRKYSARPLSIEEISQILWAAYGISDPMEGRHTAPSAGALYPIRIYLVLGEGPLEPGIYKYKPHRHELCLIKRGDPREELYEASLEQEWILDAPAVLVIAADFTVTTSVYGNRGIRYVWMEFGHVSENVYLQAAAMGLGTVAVGAFADEEVKRILGIEEEVGYLMPLGHPL
ncbi:nitroreductase [Ignicoccus pacificus DSM 13166]|uniref:Nitroreductase n=1 Tax=Ignicoccus pacificus DSM 13166 TaxID=940294 RepID=A0A977K905_9CREN|nr:nitroreductase [Ignicoccus pacificus DSM 13166]